MASITARGTTDDVERRGAKKSFNRQLRDVHLYLGTFFAPAILFFAFTGLLQTFSLHESHGGYRAPLWIQTLGRIHKDQTRILPPERKPEPEAAQKPRPTSPQEPRDEGNRIAIYVTKWFVALMALGLISTTLLGLYMAFKFSPGRRLTWVLLMLETILPVALTLA